MSGSEDKPWDYPWTTDEMRQKRREWSLAADAGLLKHLENFHNVIFIQNNINTLKFGYE